MVCVLVPLVVTALLAGTSASLSSSGAAGAEPASVCPPRWLQFGDRCFAVYPVWTSWSTARSLCSQTGGNLASLHTAEERQFVQQLAGPHGAVWLGGYQAQQNGSWFWSDHSPFRIDAWANQMQTKTGEGGTCMQMDPKSGALHGAPCGELRFYICSTEASSKDILKNSKLVEPGLVPNVSLFDVIWSKSAYLAEEILRSSSFLKELWSGHMTERCYSTFTQQEALYLRRVGSALEVLVSRLQEADDVRSLLVGTLKHYSSRNQSLLDSPPPQWLRHSLQSFHSVVLDEPVYWLVALSARACLHNFLAKEQLLSERLNGSVLVSEEKAGSFYQDWREEKEKEANWTQRYRKVIEKNQDQMDVYKAINIFREHMMNQKSFYKAVDCEL